MNFDLDDFFDGRKKHNKKKDSHFSHPSSLKNFSHSPKSDVLFFLFEKIKKYKIMFFFILLFILLSFIALVIFFFSFLQPLVSSGFQILQEKGVNGVLDSAKPVLDTIMNGTEGAQ